MGFPGAGRQDFPETGSPSQCSRPFPRPTLDGQGTHVRVSKSLFVPSSHCLKSPLQATRQDQWLSPTEGFKEASGLSHIPQPPPGQDSYSCGYRGPRVAWGGHCCSSPYLLVTGHTTQEPSHAHTVLQTWGHPNLETSTGEPGTPHPKFGKEKKAGLWAFSGSVSPFLLLCLPALPLPFPLPFHSSLHLACLSICVSKSQLLSL